MQWLTVWLRANHLGGPNLQAPAQSLGVSIVLPTTEFCSESAQCREQHLKAVIVTGVWCTQKSGYH